MHERDIGDDIFSLITRDMNNVRDYFDFKLTLNGMEQEIDDAAFSLPRDGSKGVCVQYNIVLDGCTTPLDFTAGVKLLRAGRVDSQEPCDGKDPFQSQTQSAPQEPSLFNPADYILVFPDGVYNKTFLATIETQIKKNLYIKNIGTRCNEHITSTSTEGEILACNFYFDTTSTSTPLAFGPLTLSTNFLNAVNDEVGYEPKIVYTPIFKPIAVAELISKSCMTYNGGILGVKTNIYAYSDASSYETKIKDTGSLDVSVSGSFAGIGGSAGYSQSTERSTESTDFASTAFGQRISERTYAKLEITCFTKDNFASFELQDTILPDVVNDWTFVRTFTGTKEELQTTAEFKSIAKGFLLPESYLYTASVGITMNTMYTSSTTASHASVTQTIGASLFASYLGASASTDISISSANDASLESKTSKSSSHNFRFFNGVDGDPGCLDEATAKPCERYVNAQVSAIADDISKQPRIPSKQVAHTTINDIVQGYFGDTIGLGPLFLAAVEDYYSYEVCDKPSCPSSKFTLVTGSGSKTRVKFPLNSPECPAPAPTLPPTPLYDPSRDFCFKATSVKYDQYCWYPTDNLPVGNWESGGRRKYNDCGPKCTEVNDSLYCFKTCPFQTVCSFGKEFVNLEYISDHPRQDEIKQCKPIAEANINAFC